MKPLTTAVFLAGLLVYGLHAQEQAPAPTPNLRGTTSAAIQEARSLRKIHESLSAAVTDGKASRASVDEHIAAAEKSFQSLRELIDKIDEQYDTLNESRQAAVREAWSLAKLYSVLLEQLKEAAALPDSEEQHRDLLSDCTSTARRAVMLDETLSRLQSDGRSRR